MIGKNDKALISLAIAFMIALLYLSGFFERPDLMLYDAWFRLRGPLAPGNQIVIAAMDEKSVNELGPLPWPRSTHAQLLDKLATARVVAFDLTFESSSDPSEDLAFALAMSRHGNVVLPVKISFAQEDGSYMQSYEMPNRLFVESVANLGFVNMPSDIDQIVRRTTLVDVNNDIDIPVPSFALAVYMQAEAVDPEALKLEDGRLMIGLQSVPIDKLNQALIDQWGPSGTFTTISYTDIVNDAYPGSYFDDKIVIVGSTTQERRDVYDTSFSTSNLVMNGSPPTPGAELHAAIINDMLNRRWKSDMPPSVHLLIFVVLAFISVYLLSGRHPARSAAITAGMIILSGAAIFFLWKQGLWLHGTPVFVTIIVGYGASTARDYVEAELSRRALKASFNRYVSPAVVDEIMRNPHLVELGGLKRTITIMFIDIRGFTSYSENRQAEDVVARLNEYLSMMSEEILKHDGTLDKYLGDGLMAIFGAPVFYPDHIERALAAAETILAELEVLNAEWTKRQEPALHIGIGINTGPVVIGNVGSTVRMDYTAIGEDVNLASRMEGLSKQYGTPLIISGRTIELMQEGPFRPRLKYLGEAEVKGFSLPIACWTLQD